jgi:hypothetical protein
MVSQVRWSNQVGSGYKKFQYCQVIEGITMYPEHGHTETPFLTLQQIQNPFRHNPMHPNKKNTNDHGLYAKSQ